MVRMRKEIINALTATVDISYQLFQRDGMSLVRIVAYAQAVIDT